MTDDFEVQYMDVLQNIEVAIVQVYRAQPELTDYNVEKALGALLRVYQAQVGDRAAPTVRLREIEQAVFDGVQQMCEWRRGGVEQDPAAENGEQADSGGLTVQEIVACLKRIRKSVTFWTKSGGRQGYLHYIAQFLH